MNRFLYINRRDNDEPELTANEDALFNRIDEDFDGDLVGVSYYVTVYEAVGNSFVQRTVKSKVVFSLDPLDGLKA